MTDSTQPKRSQYLAGSSVRPGPDPRWASVKPSDLGGTGFRPVEFKETNEPSRVLERVKSLNRFRPQDQTGSPSRFIHGDSPFISTYFKPVKKVVRAKPKKTKLGGEKPSPQQTAQFNAKLKKNILEISNFLIDELSVKTLAVESAIDRTRVLSSSLIDDPLDVPRTFLRRKAQEAMGMRITRFLSRYFDLTDAEAQFLMSEYDKKTLLL